MTDKPPTLKMCATRQSVAELKFLGFGVPAGVQELSSAEAEKISHVACSPIEWDTGPELSPANKIGKCCECGRAIKFRPHVPEEKLKICVPCVARLTNDSALNRLIAMREASQ